MCGIVALFFRRDPISAETVQRATQRLHHRGPDGQRQWISSDQQIALGHARLSIIDLTTGDQPIASEDERIRIVVNGEFYGYEAIQRDLERSGHRLRTRSDSEIALHLYEDVGVQCLHKLRGEFAFVLWDSTHRALFAARDRFGIKPLFYAFHGVIQENIVNIAVSLRDIGVCRGSSPNNLVPEGVRTELFIQDDLGIVPDVEVQMNIYAALIAEKLPEENHCFGKPAHI